jgi:UDP-N-acetylglucosamine acyltransferase
MANADPAIGEILTFIDSGDKRPLCMAHNNPNKPTERAHLERR